MWTCPVCNANTSDTVCTECGFDRSCDYENLRTFTYIPNNISPALKRQEEWIAVHTPDILICGYCRGIKFNFYTESKRFVCTKCGGIINIDAK